jgi:4-amino-4-deoxy-L-arabinose transferase-like glycosyltransferase
VRAWSWAIAAGLIGGLAILVKFSAAFFVIGGGLGVLLGRGSLRQDLRRPQLWSMTALGVLPGAVYLAYGIFVAGFLGRQFSGRFIPALLVSPDFYLNWLSTLNHVLGGPVLALALLGIFFTRERAARCFLVSLWAAYAVYGVFFDYHIWSHDYYNLPLIPIAALSLAAPGERFMARLAETVAGSRVQRLMAAAILTAGLFAVVWEARAVLKAVDSRPAAAMWAEIGARLGPQARLVSLTEDYGSSLAYWGWLDTAVWPQAGDIAYHSDLRGARGDFEKRFQNLALKREFFLVTLPDELDLQPLLKERLDEYPLLFEGDGYVIYDLR